jgi:hypothetical protein
MTREDVRVYLIDLTAFMTEGWKGGGRFLLALGRLTRLGHPKYFAISIFKALGS